MDAAIWVALIGLIGTVIASVTGGLGVRRAQLAERRERVAAKQKAAAETQKAEAEERAEAERAERARMDERWNNLITAQAAEIERYRQENARLAALVQQLLEQRGTTT